MVSLQIIDHIANGASLAQKNEDLTENSPVY